MSDSEKTCERCEKEAEKLEKVNWIKDRFDVDEVSVCKKCAEEIKKSNISFRN